MISQPKHSSKRRFFLRSIILIEIRVKKCKRQYTLLALLNVCLRAFLSASWSQSIDITLLDAYECERKNSN